MEITYTKSWFIRHAVLFDKWFDKATFDYNRGLDWLIILTPPKSPEFFNKWYDADKCNPDKIIKNCHQYFNEWYVDGEFLNDQALLNKYCKSKFKQWYNKKYFSKSDIISSVEDKLPSLEKWFDKDLADYNNGGFLGRLICYYLNKFDIWWDETKFQPSKTSILQDPFKLDDPHLDGTACSIIIESDKFKQVFPHVSVYLNSDSFLNLHLNQSQNYDLWKDYYYDFIKDRTKKYKIIPSKLISTLSIVGEEEIIDYIALCFRNKDHHKFITYETIYELFNCNTEDNNYFENFVFRITNYKLMSEYMEWVKTQPNEEHLKLLNIIK